MTKIKNPTHGSFLSMKKRCNEPSHRHYKYYGGRGIKVCKRWKYFKNFAEDMGERPQGKTLDRIDSDLGYFKGNCKWSDKYEQAKNRRLPAGKRNKSWVYNGVTKTKEDWAKLVGINFHTLRERIDKLNWSMEDALTTPVRGKNSRKIGGFENVLKC